MNAMRGTYPSRWTMQAFKAKWAEPYHYAGPCPTPPSFCSPAGAFLDPE
jgi:hypothetical protein